MISDVNNLIGSKHVFPDGVELKIIDVKRREDEPWVTYEAGHPSSLQRRFSLKLSEFLTTFGHLFKE